MSNVNKQLLDALKALFASYKQLADSGDAGNWRIEDYPEGRQALEAIAAAEATQPQRECSCGWVGNLDDCVWCGRVGPLCPNCHETTETAQPAAYATQWWLASVSQHGNPTLEDGAHSKREGANQAFYLINALGVAGSKEYAVAKVELYHPVADGSEVDHKAVADFNTARSAIGANKAQQPTAEHTPQLSGNSGQLPAVAVPDEWVNLAKALLLEIEKNTCTHENTHRGGVMWEICDCCNASWADDEGGKPEFKWPDAVEKARAMLDAALVGECSAERMK